jgi:hypothetical protein
MNREEVIRLAREAGAGWTLNGSQQMLIGETQLERFAALVAAAEREECAKVVERYAEANQESDLMVDAFTHCAAAIRGRK